MFKEFLNQKVALPSLQFVMLCVLGMLLATSLYKHNDTVYLINKTFSTISGDSDVVIGGEKSVSPKLRYEQDVSNKSKTNKTFANVQTMVVWGFFGLVLYYLAYIFFMIFIHPIETDKKESRFVHANKKYLKTKRVMWCCAVVFVTIASIGLWVMFTQIIAPYYLLAIYEFSISALAVFLLSVALSVSVAVGIKLGCRVIIRAY